MNSTSVSANDICDRANDSKVVVSTYNEPLITSEWAVEVFKEAKQRKLWTARSIGINRALDRFEENRLEKFFIQRIPPTWWQPGCCFRNDTNGIWDGNLTGIGHLVDSGSLD